MFNKEYTIKDFEIKTNDFVKVQKDTGRLSSYTHTWDINYSDILTTLIQAAGRYCERYASDLFIHWQTVERDYIQNSELENGFHAIKAFGFRESGVDHLEYILNHLNNGYSTYYYRAIYTLEISVNDGEMTMKLAKTNV